MIFTTITFGVFALIVIPLYYLLGHKWQNAMLLVASYVFYGWWDWRFLLLLWLSTVVDFYIARRMDRRTGAARRRLMLVSVGLNLAYLGFFKYCNFFVRSAHDALATLGVHVDLPLLQIALPVGISFYTFQSISYIVDVYRNSREHTDDFVAFALYLAYFPHLVAGPIQRSTQLLPQILLPRKVTQDQLERGAALILVGFFKKLVIADNVAPTVNTIFDAPGARPRLELLLGTYLFALQIYCDFAGYTDIARGVSRLMGIELRLNFRQPYLSTNITDFWRRWHISLSDWLRDYLYISLGGNRGGKWRTYRNLMLTMLLGGLWHGASWNFVIWGGLHGLYLAAHKALVVDRRDRRGAAPASRGPLGFAGDVLGVVVTFHLVCLAWVFFRAPTLASSWTYLRGIVVQGGYVTPRPILDTIIYLPLVLLVDLPAWLRREEQPVSDRWPWLARGLSYGLMLVACLWIGAPGGTPFIYFQF
jgi:D-alanyl-lipoteichoic acid acyltransferase DltB (MBOAT superfamily)